MGLKQNIILSGSRSHVKDCNFDVKYGDIVVVNVGMYNYLGVMLDRNLMFDNHVDNMIYFLHNYDGKY